MRNVRIAVLCRCAGGSRSEPDGKISFSLVKTNPLSLATSRRQKTGKLRLNRSQSQREPPPNRLDHRLQKFIGVVFPPRFRVRARCRGYFGAFNHHVFYVLCRLQGRVVGPWTDIELGAFDALFYVVYLGMDRFSHSLFRDLSRDRRKDYRQVAIGTSSGSRREKRRHLSPGFSTLDWNGWLCSRIVRFPVDSVEPREERMARLFGPYLGNQRLVKNRRNELCRR